MTTLVVLTVVELVLLVAGLAAYLWIVGGQLTTVAGTLEECDELVATIEQNAAVITPGVEHINRTGGCHRRRAAVAVRHGRGHRRRRDLQGTGARCRASPGHAGRRHPPLALPRSGRLPALGRGVRIAAGRERAGGGRVVLADPLVFPRGVVLIGVAARVIDRRELAHDLLSV